jgi:uncharacterized membrane protein
MARKSAHRKRYRYRTNTQDLDWDEERAAADWDHQKNIGQVQRLVSAIAGAGFLAGYLRRRSVLNVVLAMAGVGLLYRAASGYCPAFGALGIDMSGDRHTDRLGRRKVHSRGATKIMRTIVINRSPSELYGFWRSLENLPRVMSHLESVEVITERLSHWVISTSMGVPAVEWDAEIINDVENERIGWRSLSGADVDNTGSVKFEPVADGKATKLTVSLQYAPPAGKIGTAIAKLIGEDPDLQIAEDLQRFKESMEAGLYSESGRG